MKLFKEIQKNSSLKFIDAKTKEILKFKDLLFNISPIEQNNKQLVFLYCNHEKNLRFHRQTLQSHRYYIYPV